MYKILINDNSRFSCSSYLTIFEWWISLMKTIFILSTSLSILVCFLSARYHDNASIYSIIIIVIISVTLCYKCFVEVTELNLSIISDNPNNSYNQHDSNNTHSSTGGNRIIIKKYNSCRFTIYHDIIEYDDLHSIIIHEYIDVLSVNTCLALRFKRINHQTSKITKRKKKKDEQLYLIFNELYPGIDVIKEIFKKMILMAPKTWNN